MPIDRAAALKNAEKLLRQGKLEQAITEYARVVQDQPADWTTRNTLGDLCMRAGHTERAVAEYTQIADAFRHEGFFSKAGALYRKILKIKPGDEHAMLQGAEIAASQGLLRDARDGFTAIIDRRRAQGDAAGALALVVRVGRLDPTNVNARLAAARALVELGDADAAKEQLRALAHELTEKRDARADAVLEELVRLSPDVIAVEIMAIEARLTRTPHDVAALSRLVELAVDAGLDDVLTDAQVRLAEAHLAGGAVTESRWVAEDLVARHPDDVAHVERLRRVLIAAGEADIDRLIAAIIGVASPEPEPEPRPRAVDPVLGPAIAELSSSASAALPEDPVVSRLPSCGAPAEPITSRPAVPVAVVPPPTVIKRPAPAPVGEAQHRPDNIEIDLSVVLDQIHRPQEAPDAPATNLDDVFAVMRDEARRRLALDAAEQDYRRGITLFQAGQVDDAIAALESAAKLPRFRFEAAALLGRIFLNRGDLARAIEWLDRASEAPAPAPDDLHKVLYNLADALESIGETARALAVSMQLQALAGRFLDVTVRIKRLSDAQERG